jgi:hypothetical protein
MASIKQPSECWSFNELKKKPLVLVTWKDITSTHCGWFDSVDELSTAIVTSPGWIIAETADEIKLVANIGRHGNDIMFGFDTVLPKGCIEEIKILRKIWWK